MFFTPTAYYQKPPTTPLILPEDTVLIGSQTWTSTNLDVDTYRDGTPIPQVTNPIAWAALTTGAWCYMDNDPVNGAIYGKLYNWYAVAGIDGTGTTRYLAPAGYHIPTYADWGVVVNYLRLDGLNIDANKMKEIGNIHWAAPSAGTNTTGFTSLPGGYRTSTGTFTGMNQIFYTWNSDANSLTDARYVVHFSHASTTSFGVITKKSGMSVRCILD
jgi:uncharacterized protein (TIGR02145 family)